MLDKDIRDAIATSWSRNISTMPNEWKEDIPFLGQTDITALLVEDLFGHHVLKTELLMLNQKRLIPHYCNYYIESGEAIIADMTTPYHPEGTLLMIPFKFKPNSNLRMELFSNGDTKRRYEALNYRTRRKLLLDESPKLG